MNRLANIHKIAVLRATQLGDFVNATPALYALAETYPDAEIVYLGKPWHKEFLTGRPGPVDRVEIVPPKPGVRNEDDTPEDAVEVEAFCERMRQEHFDLVIQMNGGGANTNPFVRRFNGRVAVGMRTPDAPPLDRWMPYLFYQHEVMRLLELVALVGAQPCRFDLRVELTSADFVELRRGLPDLPPDYVVLHPGASDGRRRWPPERFAAIGDLLFSHGYQVVITGVEAERAVCQRIMDLMASPAVDACHRLSVSGLSALLSQAILLISNDTGPLHLAAAVGTPTVGIFWCGNFTNWANLNRTMHRPIPAWITHCPHCGADMTTEVSVPSECPHDACFVETISVEKVAEAALDLLAHQRKPVALHEHIVWEEAQ